VFEAWLGLDRAAVRGLVAEDEEKRPGVLAPKPGDGLVGDRGGVVARDATPLSVVVELVVEVVALPAMTEPVIETRTAFIVVLAHVPLPHVGRLIPRLLEPHGETRQFVRILREIVPDTVLPCITSAQQRRTAG